MVAIGIEEDFAHMEYVNSRPLGRKIYDRLDDLLSIWPEHDAWHQVFAGMENSLSKIPFSFSS